MATSVKINVYHLFLMTSLLITSIDSLYLFINVWNNGSGLPPNNESLINSTTNSTSNSKSSSSSSLIFDDEPTRRITYCIIVAIRFIFAFLMLIYGYIYGLRYKDHSHLFIHSMYFIWICGFLFVLGIIITYQQFVWSLVIQIIHLYISLIYTFKAFLYHYDDKIDANLDFGRRTAEFEEIQASSTSLDRASKRTRYGKVLYFVNKNLLAISTLLMILLAISIAILLRHTLIPGKPWSQRRLLRLAFIGEIFIRVLLSLIVPLVGSSIAYACTGFDPELSGHIMWEVMVYYLSTTGFAAIEGLIIVSIIGPGYHTRKSVTTVEQKIHKENSTKLTITIEDTIMDICRNIFTDNIFDSWIETYHTKLVPPIDNPNELNKDKWRIESVQERGANIMSVVVVGLLVGLSINMIRTHGGRILVEIIETVNTIMMMITLAVVQTAPVCTVFLIIPQILIVDDIGEMFSLVGWFTLTVLISLSIHCFVVLPLIYLVLVRKNPFNFLSYMFPAISTAFATSSSSATMSVTMNCLENDAGVEPTIVRFVIPFGSTVNMDGAALYESVAAIFVAQYRRKSLNLGQLVTIAMTSILVSIGAAGIPQAGMITTVVVLNSIGLSLEDAALVMVVDFMLDRFRTVVNVLGDAFGAGVVGHRLQYMFNNTNNNNNNNLRSSSSSVITSTNFNDNNNLIKMDKNQIILRNIEKNNNNIDNQQTLSSTSMTTMTTLTSPKTITFETKSTSKSPSSSTTTTTTEKQNESNQMKS
ncbi:excitatory amino acid transporter 3-like [Dermatophagoides pteronyssinus]|uniref:Amino acid transporter n=2 Tax=Dermatophagoides pteronyssinus TaxID=6956 RepID=A0ABQ8JJG6_DERPT|nr:hypothetical protein DERP_003221 [Dermatophagoides pteronyssinus]